MQSLAGQLLISAPELTDANFAQTVVLLVQHDDDGAMGLVLNRPTGTKLASVWSQVSETPCNSPAVICAGGPIQGPLMAIHNEDRLAESEIVPGVLITTSRDHITTLVERDTEPVKFFAGYAGWGSGQLEGEIAERAWLIAPATKEQVFEPHFDQWEQLLKAIHGAKLASKLGIKHVPLDARVN